MKTFILFIFISFNCFCQKNGVASFPFNRVVYDGNSLFSRGNGNVANVFEAPLNCQSTFTVRKPPFYLVAISGKTISALITDFTTKVSPLLQPGDIVALNEGTNSLNILQNPTTVYNQLLQYRDSVRAHGCKIVVSTITARGTATAYVGFEADRLIYNSNLITNASQFDGVVQAGENAAFSTVAGTTNLTNYNIDELHFSTDGYLILGQLFASVLQPLLKY